MRLTLSLIVFLAAWGSYAQALLDINFNYLYNSSESYRMVMRAVKSADGWDIYFSLQMTDSVSSAGRFMISWELRESYASDRGVALDSPGLRDHDSTGSISIKNQSGPVLLVATVTDNETKRSRIFYKALAPDYPVNGYLFNTATGSVHLNSFVLTDQSFTISEVERNVIVSYFNDDFPAASPAFSETLGRVAPAIKVDSSFAITERAPVVFGKQGLYLMQRDTAEASGFAFRAEDDYPKYSKLQSLYGPMVYISTRSEYDRLKAAHNDKKAFDKVILGITRDAERARNFMRSYYRRVEMANRLFTSYKEGWKTDRGMIYIIFGLPEEVYMSDNREVWKYDNDQHKLSFSFIRSGTLFDPDNFVLIRDKKYQRIWYETVDLWRNARF